MINLHDPYAAFVYSRVKWLDSLALNLHHATTGLVGEAIEFFHSEGPEHECEELGDIEFYLEHFFLSLSRVGMKPGVLPKAGLVHMSTYDRLILACGNLLDGTKKLWIYEKPFEWGNFAPYLAEVIWCLDHLCEERKYTRTWARRDNMAKLVRRYPQGYSNQAAQARADKEGG